MSDQNIFPDLQDLLKKFEQTATDFFEGATEAFLGKAETLRDGTELEPVVLPRDLYAHAGAQTEWWYYTGHAETASGKRFGFAQHLSAARRQSFQFPFTVTPASFSKTFTIAEPSCLLRPWARAIW